jgi:hypothetical protein
MSRPAESPRPSRLRAPSWLNAPRNLAHRSRLGAAAACVSTWCGMPLGQRRAADSPCDSSCVTTRDASDRLLPSHVLRTSTRASWVPVTSCAFAPRGRGDRLSHVSAIRFGGPHVLPMVRRGGLVVPAAVRAYRPSGIPVASSTSVTPLARNAHSRKPPRPSWARPRERCESFETIRDTFHLARTFAPQRSLERPAQDFPGSAAWPPQNRFSTPSHPSMTLSDPGGPGSRPRAPLPTGVALL